MTLVSTPPLLMQRALRAFESYRDDRWEACVLSQRSPSKNSHNEDAAAVIPLGDASLVLVVADGCGGMRGGEKASGIAIRSIVKSLRLAMNCPRLVRGAILDGMEQANDCVQSLRIGAACTVVAVECFKDRIRSYHVGDSMVVVTNRVGRVRYQSVCHSPVGYAVESGWLNENQAMYHKDRHLVSNLVGNPSMRIEVGPWVKLSRCDKVLVASDGLFDNLSLTEIARKNRSTRDLGTCIDRLAKLATRRMDSPSDSVPSKPDDLTIIGLQRH